MPMMIPINSKPEFCPKCKNRENKITVCKNCSYEYKEDNDFPILIFWIPVIGEILSMIFITHKLPIYGEADLIDYFLAGLMGAVGLSAISGVLFMIIVLIVETYKFFTK